MAKITIKETLVGTNEQIKAVEAAVKEAFKTVDERYSEQFGVSIDDIQVQVTYDQPKESPLQKQLRDELAQFRPLLSEQAIKVAEDLIESLDGSEETIGDILNSYHSTQEDCEDEDDDYIIEDDEDEDDEDCDCDEEDEDDCDEDDYEDAIVRIIVGII